MPQFIEIKGIIIAVDNISWVEYQNAEQIKTVQGVDMPGMPIEPEGRTYVIPKNGGTAQWIAGDVRDRFCTLLGIVRVV